MAALGNSLASGHPAEEVAANREPTWAVTRSSAISHGDRRLRSRVLPDGRVWMVLVH